MIRQFGRRCADVLTESTPGRRRLTAAWLIVLLASAVFLAWRVHGGIPFDTNLMALLPVESRDPVSQRAHDAVTGALARQTVILVGHAERERARAAALTIMTALRQSGRMEIASTTSDSLQRIGALYYPWRDGLLAETDRRRLLAGEGKALAERALSQVYGFVGMADANLLRSDPFLLLPAFFAGLPLPLSRLAPDDGLLTVTDTGTTWIAIPGRLLGEPHALAEQRLMTAVLDDGIARLNDPGVTVLRLGAVFFAQAAAEAALQETSTIAIVSTLGTVLVVLLAFRALAPLWLSLLVIGAGVLMGMAGSLLLFGAPHISALLFGVTLIGVAVDYSLQYCSEIFTTEASPQRRLRRVLAAITLGTATTVVGYLTLLLAPFPGLHQLAAFSAIGLIAAWITVVLFLPWLDPSLPARHGGGMLTAAGFMLTLWERSALAMWRRGAVLGIIVVAAAGMARFQTDDDVRRLQSLSPALLAQQARIQSLTGMEPGGPFFLVQAADTEAALRLEEALSERLRPLVVSGALAGFRGPADFVPSAARQRENRALRARELGGEAARLQYQQLNLPPPAAEPAASGTSSSDGFLTLGEAIRAGGPLQSLSYLVLGDSAGAPPHAVMLDRVTQPDLVRDAARGLPGVGYVDPVSGYSALLGQYRDRAVVLLALSAVLMVPLIAWRHGWRGALWIMAPPLLAVALVPGLRALTGATFSFFDAIALVLILSIGVDYAVFLAETSDERRRVTMLAVLLAASTALMSFGLLALSEVHAVHSFGASMAAGILLACLLAPMVRRR